MLNKIYITPMSIKWFHLSISGVFLCSTTRLTFFILRTSKIAGVILACIFFFKVNQGLE